VAVWNKQSMQEAAKSTRVFVAMVMAVAVIVVMAMRVAMTVVVVVRVIVAVVTRVNVVVGVTVVVRVVVVVQVGGGLRHAAFGDVFHAVPLSWSAWWCRGVPPRVCSAWKIASATSWRACSFSNR